jgi:uncharacterized protein involved in exopolysaccharide biosynthesis
MPDGSRKTATDVPESETFTRLWGERDRPAFEPSPAERGAGLLQTFRDVARRHRWRMLAVAAATVAASALAYPHLPRRYQGSAQVMLQPTGQEGQSDFAREARNSLDENSIQSEMEVLSSRALAAEVARRLRLSSDPEFNLGLRPEGRLATAKRTVAEALRSAGMVSAEPARPSRPGVEERAIERTLLEHLSVKRDRRSYVLRIGFWSEDPERAAELANALAEAYIEGQLERKRAAQVNVAGWLERRVEELRGRHDRSEQANQDYLVETGLVDAGADTSLQQQLTTFSAELALAQSRALDLQARARLLVDLQRAGALDSAPEVIASPVVQHLRERVVTLGAGVGSTQGGGPIGAPMSALNELRQAAGAEAQRILRAAQTESSVAQQREAGIRAEIARIREEMTRRKLAERRLEALRREATADREALEQAMGRHRTEAGRIAVLRPDAELLTVAEAPLKAAFPNDKMVAFGTLALALVAALASILPPLLRRRRVAA